MLKFINLYSQAEHNKINYQHLSGLVEKSIKKPSSDLSVVIPAYGRNEFLRLQRESLMLAYKYNQT